MEAKKESRVKHNTKRTGEPKRITVPRRVIEIDVSRVHSKVNKNNKYLVTKRFSLHLYSQKNEKINLTKMNASVVKVKMACCVRYEIKINADETSSKP